MSEFEVVSVFVGCGQAGKRRVERGLEDRSGPGAMALDGPPQVETAVVQTASGVADHVTAADVVIATGDLSESGVPSQALQVAAESSTDCVLVGLFSGTTDPREYPDVVDAFGTVVGVDRTASRSCDDVIQEGATDVFSAFLQPMLLKADHIQIYDNLRESDVAVLCRAVGERTEIEDVVESCETSDHLEGTEQLGEVLFGYAEFGEAFTLTDAHTLEGSFGDPPVIVGQATLDDPSRCRLTVLRSFRDS